MEVEAFTAAVKNLTIAVETLTRQTGTTSQALEGVQAGLEKQEKAIKNVQVVLDDPLKSYSANLPSSKTDFISDEATTAALDHLAKLHATGKLARRDFHEVDTLQAILQTLETPATAQQIARRRVKTLYIAATRGWTAASAVERATTDNLYALPPNLPYAPSGFRRPRGRSGPRGYAAGSGIQRGFAGKRGN